MKQFEPNSNVTRNFVGREAELRWLEEYILHRRHAFYPLFISGPGGVGKTALLQHFFSINKFREEPFWVDLSAVNNPDEALSKLTDQFSEFMLHNRESRRSRVRDFRDGDRDGVIVVIDSADTVADIEIENSIRRIRNYKAVRAVVVATRKAPETARAESLPLGPLTQPEIESLLQQLLHGELNPNALDDAVRSTNGIPLAAQILAELLKAKSPREILELVNGQLYDFTKIIAVPKSKIIETVSPVIISANDALMAQLKKQPDAIYKLTPRKFEELLADLLTDMGWQVELTKATRDGGKDILAYLNTDVGKLLCLIEAKQYRKERKVSVDLVRTLYGTLCDYEANSAMMVTTSTFTSDAHAFQKRHPFQLSLRDYGHIVSWIQRYKQDPRTPERT